MCPKSISLDKKQFSILEKLTFYFTTEDCKGGLKNDQLANKKCISVF